MESKNFTINIDDGVMLRLDTYNELYTKAVMLDAIVENTIDTIALAPKHSDYTAVRVDVSGSLVLPAYVMDQVIDKLANSLAHQNADYMRSLVEADMHIFDFGDFSFESYRHRDNPLEFDLMKNKEFRRRWDEETKRIELEKKTGYTPEEEDE